MEKYRGLDSGQSTLASSIAARRLLLVALLVSFAPQTAGSPDPEPSVEASMILGEGGNAFDRFRDELTTVLRSFHRHERVFISPDGYALTEQYELYDPWMRLSEHQAIDIDGRTYTFDELGAVQLVAQFRPAGSDDQYKIIDIPDRKEHNLYLCQELEDCLQAIKPIPYRSSRRGEKIWRQQVYDALRGLLDQYFPGQIDVDEELPMQFGPEFAIEGYLTPCLQREPQESGEIVGSPVCLDDRGGDTTAVRRSLAETYQVRPDQIGFVADQIAFGDIVTGHGNELLIDGQTTRELYRQQIESSGLPLSTQSMLKGLLILESKLDADIEHPRTKAFGPLQMTTGYRQGKARRYRSYLRQCRGTTMPAKDHHKARSSLILAHDMPERYHVLRSGHFPEESIVDPAWRSGTSRHDQQLYKLLDKRTPGHDTDERTLRYAYSYDLVNHHMLEKLCDYYPVDDLQPVRDFLLAFGHVRGEFATPRFIDRVLKKGGDKVFVCELLAQVDSYDLDSEQLDEDELMRRLLYQYRQDGEDPYVGKQTSTYYLRALAAAHLSQ